jgi:hypothetical protein
MRSKKNVKQERRTPPEWPPAFEPLVAEFGADRVYEVGMDVLGFPPNWSFPSKTQVAAVDAALRKGV